MTSHSHNQSDSSSQLPLNHGNVDSSDTQTLLFGSRVEKLFDRIHQLMEPILREGISTLPLLNAADDDDTLDYSTALKLGDPSVLNVRRRDKLFHLIYSSYAENMDLAELYAVRNIFTLDGPVSTHYTKRQKADIINRFWNLCDPKDESSSNPLIEKEVRPARPNTSVNTEFFSSIAKDVVDNNLPSPSEIRQLQTNLETTRTELRQAKSRQHVLTKQLLVLNQYASQTLPLAENVFTSSIEQVPWENITHGIMMEKNDLQQEMRQGQDKIQQLQQLRTDRGPSSEDSKTIIYYGDETIEFGKAMREEVVRRMEQEGQKKKQKKITELDLEEEYAQRVNHLGKDCSLNNSSVVWKKKT